MTRLILFKRRTSGVTTIVVKWLGFRYPVVAWLGVVCLSVAWFGVALHSLAWRCVAWSEVASRYLTYLRFVLPWLGSFALGMSWLVARRASGWLVFLCIRVSSLALQRFRLGLLAVSSRLRDSRVGWLESG